MQAAHAEAAMAETEHDDRCLDLSPKRLLVGDDDEDARRLIAAALRRKGYDVVEASDGLELLARIEATAVTFGKGEKGFDAIVADDQMPHLTGLDVLAALGCARFEVPFILVTAFADRETHAEARALGATACLEKPFRIDELDAAIEAATLP
jgi:CheY-like chemotaxis protein